MRKYRPRIRLVRLTTATGGNQSSSPDDDNEINIDGEHVTRQVLSSSCPTQDVASNTDTRYFQFHGCVFIAVTAYQNQLVSLAECLSLHVNRMLSGEKFEAQSVSQIISRERTGMSSSRLCNLFVVAVDQTSGYDDISQEAKYLTFLNVTFQSSRLLLVMSICEQNVFLC